MSLPGNGIFVVQGEMAMLVTAMRRSTRWGSHSFPNEEYEVLMRTFEDLKTILNQVGDLRLLDPSTYLGPFLEVIRSKDTTGPVTSLALSAIHKFLSYALIDPTHPSVPAAVEDIADAVTHARFVGTDHSSDGVVLMKILQVLRTLMLSPEGTMLTDESVCEIMLSCFRICFETRLTELLRRNAEQCLRDMTQHVFQRLALFPAEGAAGAAGAGAEAAPGCSMGLSLKRRGSGGKKKGGTLERTKSMTERAASPPAEGAGGAGGGEGAGGVGGGERDAAGSGHTQDRNLLNEAEITIEPVARAHARHSSMDLQVAGSPITQLLEKCVSAESAPAGPDQEVPQTEAAETPTNPEDCQDAAPEARPDEEQAKPDEPGVDGATGAKTPEPMEEYVNDRGVRFTQQDEAANLQPYGLVCVTELFRFLISLCDPLDAQNTSGMVHLGLSLARTALEVAAPRLAQRAALLELLRHQLSRNLISLLSTERISIFALDLQVSFLLFESLRHHLKFQLEAFFKKIIEIVSTDITKAPYELREIHHLALEYLAQMFRVPGLCAELYLNFDCDVYCTSVFEELVKLLSKNVVASSAHNVHSLSLEALMAVVEAIEGAIALDKAGAPPPAAPASHVSLELGLPAPAPAAPAPGDVIELLDDLEHLDSVREMKQWVVQGSALFNAHPERGVALLQRRGWLAAPADAREVARLLRENPLLDKRMIGEYLCKRSSRDPSDDADSAAPSAPEDPSAPADPAAPAPAAPLSVLSAFAESFDFAGLRLDQALRLYLEAFRLPGEAPLIFLLMEKFAERWHTTNGCPFANADAAFRLAYAVIMLNMDQHNHNAKKLNVPMTPEDFVRNLRSCNGNGDFPRDMLLEIFHSIKNEEMVMPAERAGPVRDAYLWRMLRRRGDTPAARYRRATPRCAAAACAPRLLVLAAPNAITALSSAYDRAPAPTAAEVEADDARASLALRALRGLRRCCAACAACAPPAAHLCDAALLALCKLCAVNAMTSYVAIGVHLGQSVKAQLALRAASAAAARHGHALRGAWAALLDIVRALFAGRLLPKSMVEVEDYLSPDGKVSLVRESRGAEAGLLSSLYSYIALGETGARLPSPAERALMEAAAECVRQCRLPELLGADTRFLQLESLQELVAALVAAGAPPDADSLQVNPQLEDETVFFLELLGQTLVQNRDRVLTVWPEASRHVARCVSWAAALPAPRAALGRVLTAALRVAAALMRAELCAPAVLAALAVLFDLPYAAFYEQADVIACGLYDIVKTSAQNVHTSRDWELLFSLLAACAGAWPHPTEPASSASGSESDGERRPTSASSDSELSASPHAPGWIVVHPPASRPRPHRAAALARAVSALALILRDAAHVTPHNCAAAVRAVRLCAAAERPRGRERRPRRAPGDCSSDDEDDAAADLYTSLSLQLLDLMHTLHSRTAQIFTWWKEEADQGNDCGADPGRAYGAPAAGPAGGDYDLWQLAWMPLLQGIAQYCIDRRRQVANSAIAYLQRALLAPGLAALGAAGWEACFHRVLFPLVESARNTQTARANTIMCKVFLQHLPSLAPLGSFPALWGRVLRAQAALLAREALSEAARESLKNMLLVMHSVKIFESESGYNELWHFTWEKVDEFLPGLKQELFPEAQDVTMDPSRAQSSPAQASPALATILPPAPLPAILPAPVPTPLPGPPTLLPVQVAPISKDQTDSPRPQTISLVQSPIGISQPPFGLVPHQMGSIHSQTSLIPPQSGSIHPQTGSIHPQTGSIHPQTGSIQHQVRSKESQVHLLNPQLVPMAPTLLVSQLGPSSAPGRSPPSAHPGLPSSFLLQPLNEMISTPIDATTNQMPILYPTDATRQELSENQPKLQAEECSLQETLENFNTGKDVEQGELYSEYLSDPYVTPLSAKEATIYEPANTVQETTDTLILDYDKQKSFSANVSPMHASNKAQFGSTDNLKESSGLFNFSSYFGASQGSEVFDNLMSTQEG